MFGLIWQFMALEQLADVFITLTPDEQDHLTAAIEALNQRLRSNPLDEGESRARGYRITFVYKLAISFHVSDRDQLVRVIWVKRYGP